LNIAHTLARKINSRRGHATVRAANVHRFTLAV
jgi:hypothetical protein